MNPVGSNCDKRQRGDEMYCSWQCDYHLVVLSTLHIRIILLDIFESVFGKDLFAN